MTNTDAMLMAATRRGLAAELEDVVARDGLGRDVRRRVVRARYARRAGLAAVAVGAVAVAVPLALNGTHRQGPTHPAATTAAGPRITLAGYVVSLPAGYRVDGTSAVGPNGEVVHVDLSQSLPTTIKRITFKGKDAFLVQDAKGITLYVPTKDLAPGALVTAERTGGTLHIDDYVVLSATAGVTQQQLESWMSDERP